MKLGTIGSYRRGFRVGSGFQTMWFNPVLYFIKRFRMAEAARNDRVGKSGNSLICEDLFRSFLLLDY